MHAADELGMQTLARQTVPAAVSLLCSAAAGGPITQVGKVYISAVYGMELPCELGHATVLFYGQPHCAAAVFVRLVQFTWSQRSHAWGPHLPAAGPATSFLNQGSLHA